MTEISTTEVNSVNLLSNDQLGLTDDLEPHEKQFYKALSAQLNAIQLSPKKEIILKIINYSRSKNRR